MCPHFGFYDVMSLSGKKSNLKSEFWKFSFKFGMGNRRFFTSIDFLMDRGGGGGRGGHGVGG